MTTSEVRATLEQIGAIDSSRVVRFAERTRDQTIPVYHDPLTGVIFIDDFYVGETEYEAGTYRCSEGNPDFEDYTDTQRRVDDFRPLYHERRVLDFGCGAGNFLRSVRPSVTGLCGVELQTSLREALNREGIMCYENLSLVTEQVDVAFMFHVLEHLPNPLPVLKSLRAITNSTEGLLVVEVPHARDFLITEAKCQSFIDFTLWSQHLVLHTRDSLRKLIHAAGFNDVSVYGVQRYGLSNHLTWLLRGEPGGHKGPISHFEDRELFDAYRAALARQDSTDTLIAIAR